MKIPTVTTSMINSRKKTYTLKRNFYVTCFCPVLGEKVKTEHILINETITLITFILLRNGKYVYYKSAINHLLFSLRLFYVYIILPLNAKKQK